MEFIVETMIEHSIETKQFMEAIGLSIDSRRLDKLEVFIII